MRTFCVIFAALVLAACATPRPIADTASLVSKMSNDMDRSITNYVGSLRAAREADTRRLQGLRADADSHRIPIRDDLQIMALVEDGRPARVLNGLAMAPDPDPLRPGVAASVAPAPVSFDDAPLKTVAMITGDIAKPASAAEQFAVLFKFAKTVNDDLQKATGDNEKSASPTPQP
jgi:hypothetical protein